MVPLTTDMNIVGSNNLRIDGNNLYVPFILHSGLALVLSLEIINGNSWGGAWRR